VSVIQATIRKVILYGIVCLFMQRSGFVTIVNVESHSGANILGEFISIGWNNLKWSHVIDESKSDRLVLAGAVVGWTCEFVIAVSFLCWMYLLRMVARLYAGKCGRYLFSFLSYVMLLLWIGAGAFFYYQFSLYWNDGGKSAVPIPNNGKIDDNVTGTPMRCFWFPTWGALLWLVNLYYLIKLSLRSCRKL